MKVIVIGDKIRSVRFWLNYLTEIDGVKILEIYTSIIEAFNARSKFNEIDLILFEIETDHSSLIEVVTYFRKITKFLIIISKTNKFTQLAFAVKADNYFVKPILKESFNLEIAKLKEELISKPNVNSADFGYLYLKGDSKNSFGLISINEIIFIESLRNYIILNYQDANTLESKISITYLSLNEAEKTLERLFFLRISRSHIVSLRHILKVSGNTITLKNEKVLTVGGKYREKFFKHINMYKLN